MSLFSEADLQRIEAAVARIEQRSASEVVVAVHRQSAQYSRWRALVAGCWALGASWLWFRVYPDAGHELGLVLQLPVALLVWWVLGFGPLRRRLIAPSEAERAVRARAFQLFAERGVHRTRDRTGILLFISELEHRVVLLGDTGIHERLGTSGWERHTRHLVQRIREGKALDGVLEVLGELEQVLASELPVRGDDEDELPNAVVRG